MGLIFFMFFLGLELDLNQIKKSWKTTIPVVCASVIVPGEFLPSLIKVTRSTIVLVGIGCAVALWLYDMNSDLQTSKVAFILFIGKTDRC